MEHSEQQDFRLIACPHVFSIEKGRIDVLRPAGGTVNDLIRSIGWTPDRLSARVFIDGEYVKDAAWEYTVPRAGQSVVVRAVPMGGEGGKDTTRLVAMVAVMALAIAVSGGAFAPLAAAFGAGGMGLLAAGSTYAVLAGAAVSIIGTLALNGLIPSPLPRRALPHQPMDDHREVAA